jgi:hypothetical protein
MTAEASVNKDHANEQYYKFIYNFSTYIICLGELRLKNWETKVTYGK